MSPRQHSPIPMTWSQVTAFRASRHHLSERASKKALLSVVYDMTGAQAQLFSAAQISLWSRVRDLQIADIEKAFDQRKLVKASCMRRTIFLVPSKHLATFVRGTARRAEKEIRWALGKGVPERVVDAAIVATLEVLDQPLTRPEIAERVSQSLGVQIQTYHGGGWGSRRKLAAVPIGELNYPVVELLHLVAARGVVCYGPSRGNEPTFVRADAWNPNWQDLPAAQAEDRLLRRYLQTYGPATAEDFSIWTGISLREARQIWTRAEAGFASVNVEGWEATVLRKDLTALVQASHERPSVRLLPYFDSYLLGHKDRQHLVSLNQHSKIYRAQGWIAPVVLVNGRAAGVWEHALQANRMHLKIAKFEPFSRQIIDAIHEEAQDLGRFLGTPIVDVQIS